MAWDRETSGPEHLPNSYVSRRSTEAQAYPAWEPPTGPLGELTRGAELRTEALAGRSAELMRAARSAPPQPSFGSAIRGKTVGIVAELKRSSPSRGVIDAGLDASKQVRAYERGGAVAVSILTEPTRFGGSNQDMVSARSAIGLPILKKDFHVSVVQLLEARALGASAALVIVRAVPPDRLREMMAAARDIALELLIEVRDEAELELAVSLGAALIGVNNRNLETLAVDSSTGDRVIPLVPPSCAAISESGIERRSDVERVARSGADAVLIGASLSGSPDPESAVRSLTGVQRTAGARKN